MSENKQMREQEKIHQLLKYLLEVTKLRSTTIYDLENYEEVLWFSDIPQAKGCFSPLHSPEKDDSTDVCLQVEKQEEPECPEPPEECLEWLDESTLYDKISLPQLLESREEERVVEAEWTEGYDEVETSLETIFLTKYPEIQKIWDGYIKGPWQEWKDAHDKWESIFNVYSILFKIYQDQLRLGEEYELILGYGLLMWQNQDGQRIRRHLIVANLSLEFDSTQGKFTVKSHHDGANLRLELDMLGTNVPINEEENARKNLETAEDVLSDKETICQSLQGLVNSISDSATFDENMLRGDIKAGESPQCVYSPALVLRKRSLKGLTQAIESIQKQVATGGVLPSSLRKLAEIDSSSDRNQSEESTPSFVSTDDEIYFPLPANDEQRQIITRIQKADGLLVQGPPGTGKSHTIANLICHLLATGNKILVTSQKAPALEVLYEKIPEKLQPLNINLLGSGQEERQSLETSVQNIISKKNRWNAQAVEKEISEIRKKLKIEREQQAAIKKRLQTIREAETNKNHIANHLYKGSAADIAKKVAEKEEQFQWFQDDACINESFPLTDQTIYELKKAVAFLQGITEKEEEELACFLPDSFWDVVEIEKVFDAEKTIKEQEERLLPIADSGAADQLAMRTEEWLLDLIKKCEDLKEKASELKKIDSWLKNKLLELLNDPTDFWNLLAKDTHSIRHNIRKIRAQYDFADSLSVEYPQEIDLGILIQDAKKIYTHLNSGKKLKIFFLVSSDIKEQFYITQKVKLGGRLCKTKEQLHKLILVLTIKHSYEKIWNKWSGILERKEGTFNEQERVLALAANSLVTALHYKKAIADLLSHVSSVITNPVQSWTDFEEVHRFTASCKLAQIRYQKKQTLQQLQSIEDQLARYLLEGNAHELLSSMKDVIQTRNRPEVSDYIQKIKHLQERKKKFVAHPVFAYLNKGLWT